jgi:hypothetical protein
MSGRRKRWNDDAAPIWEVERPERDLVGTPGRRGDDAARVRQQDKHVKRRDAESAETTLNPANHRGWIFVFRILINQNVLCHICLAADDGREGETSMAKKTDTVEVTFFVGIDEKGNFAVDDDQENARDGVTSADEPGDCLDIYEVTISVPKAKAKKVHLGTIVRSEDDASITVESIEAA